ncbi:MAG: XdhC/CoxI family protein [Candidatus Cloacimonadaceae bacterium]|nr:XdhC/CoxI family protein [Candidatus Cloacimonadaceae bacterium]MDP3114620.1 XdhC/CoxI family protein [Candidatus Cloacimonadaceae bacterium]
MNNKDYYTRLYELNQKSCLMWQALIVKVQGSTPARSGMKMIIPLYDDEFGNLGGGEMEHYIINFTRKEKPEKPIVRTFLLSDTGEGVKDPEETPTAMICGGIVTVFIEPLYQVKKLFVIGAGHCGRALGHLAKLCGFQVSLIDNRKEIIESLAEDMCDAAYLNDYEHLDVAIVFDHNAHIVIMTHGHVHDKGVLEFCLDKEYAYLGMIGSKQKVAQTFANLKDKGISEELLSKVHAPIGLPIGSQTPYEIAVSIMAEMIALDRRVET